MEKTDSTPTEHSPRKKIAILGGGVGAISAAFGLTNQPDWQDKYDITVYQMGWRLGGKGASGRNQKRANRIEEHGLHVWYGFYDNAFRLIQQCYNELDRPDDRPLRRWDQAFKPHRWIWIEEFHDNRWKPWPLDFPPNHHIPGQSDRHLSILGYVKQLLKWICHCAVTLLQAPRPSFPEPLQTWRSGPNWLNDIIKKAGLGLEIADLKIATKLLQTARRLAEGIETEHRDPPSTPRFQILAQILKRLREAMWRLVKDRVESSDYLRRTWILFELATVNTYGLLVDGVIVSGFKAVDQWDYRDWLRRHGCSDMVIDSAPVRALYDVALAYPNGDTGHRDGAPPAGNLSAGVAIHCILLILFSYKGAILWKMQAGMGDVVFAPLYQVLKQRGVKFEFFHKVTDLQLSPDDSAVDKIIIKRQATLKDGLVEYAPLIDVEGLPCWPGEPLYAQLEQGEQLTTQQVDLESSWTPWSGVDQRTLQRGQDFDLVILGISIGALRPICGHLIRANAKWRDMVAHLQTVQTQTFQLWLKPSLKDLGWSKGEPILDGYVQPFNTWSDMTQTLDWESWPVEGQAAHVAYFCGPMPDYSVAISTAIDPAFPKKESERVKQTAMAWLQKNIGGLWPNATHPDDGFNWDLLVDPAEGQGQVRFEAQYWRANIEPGERYVLSVAGTTQYRLRAGDSGFANLYLAGDWTQNGLNVGCVEAAVMAGLQAAEAISGYPQEIIDGLDIWSSI